MSESGAVPELSYVQQTVLDCVREFEGKLQRSEVAKLLAGSDSVRVEAWRGSGFFGRLSRLSRRSLLHHVDVLLQQQYLDQDPFGHLYLTPRGRAFFDESPFSPHNP